jgi:hypothetical protein
LPAKINAHGVSDFLRFQQEIAFSDYWNFDSAFIAELRGNPLQRLKLNGAQTSPEVCAPQIFSSLPNLFKS